MRKKRREIVIPKEKAVFWLGKDGCWYNKFGRFEHKKIIDFFHASIQKDQGGYFLSQTTEDYTEKVYFHCEDVALFVFDIITNGDIVLVLNTRKRIKLKPTKLFMKGDNLYMTTGDEQVRFTDRSLMKMSDFIEYDGGAYFIRAKNRRYRIHQLKENG